MKQEEKSMIELFKGYTNYTEDEYKRIWKSAIIVVDTNILLNFYRYSDDTKKEMFKILTDLKERLWIPYTIAQEYFKNKNNVMVNSYDEYSKLATSLSNLFKESINEIKTKKNSQLKCKNELVKILEESNKQAEKLLLKEKEEKKPKFEENKVEEKIIELFNKSIGPKFLDEEYDNVKKEGQRRFENKIPPGYKDNQKEENADYYIFYSMMQKSKISKKDIIFITDDVKEDWFNKVNGEKHGGRYELLNEFYNETNNLLMIYTSDGFVKSYNKNIAKQTVNEKLVDELINVRKKLYLNEKYTNTIEKNEDFAYRLHNCRNHFLHNEQNINKEQLLDELIFLIKNMEAPMATKARFMNTIKESRQKFIDKDYYNNEEIMTLLNKIIMYYDEDVIYRKNYDIKHHIMREISNIHLSKTGEEILESYNRLVNYLGRYFSHSKKIEKKENFELYVQLEEIIDLIQKLINQGDTSQTSKIKLLEKLTNCVDTIDCKYNDMFSAHAN